MKASGIPVNRRHFIGGLAGLGIAQRLSANDQHIVSIKYGADPYQTAIASAGQFPDVQGKTVVIKPNLVAGRVASTGVSTDPQVVRAIVDRCLMSQAKAVLIAEGSGQGGGAAHFTGCGYDFFATYDPRVSLLDLSTAPMTVVSSSTAYLYRLMWLPEIAADPTGIRGIRNPGTEPEWSDQNRSGFSSMRRFSTLFYAGHKTNTLTPRPLPVYIRRKNCVE